MDYQPSDVEICSINSEQCFGREGVESRPVFFLANSPALECMKKCYPLLVLCRGWLEPENRGEFSLIIGLERNLL